jgi:hypothetical protein
MCVVERDVTDHAKRQHHPSITFRDEKKKKSDDDDDGDDESNPIDL